KQFLNLLADIYSCLPKPDTKYHNWLDIADNGLLDLQNNKGCLSQVNGHSYLNAYVCDYSTPPESMVQLAVLLPLLDYQQWSQTDFDIIHEIKNALSQFYDKKINSIARWLPAVEHKLDRSEEHKYPRVMDSWYLH